MNTKFSVFSLIIFILILGCEKQNTASSQLSYTPHTDQSPTLTQQHYSIVGGQLETGFHSVGALLDYNPSTNRITQSFCTATLIAPQWILSAAHCVTDEQGQRDPDRTLFYIGSDFVQSLNQENYPQDTFTEISSIIVHPNYNADTLTADIALLELDQPLTRTPIEIHRQNLSPLIGEELTYVGFGANRTQPLGGGGVKRRSAHEIAYLTNDVYTTELGSGVCFGDSGGPGLYNDNNTWYVAGVNSAVSDDICDTFSIHMRIDIFAQWIDQNVSGSVVTCQQDNALCACAQACQNNGTCDDQLCGMQNCEESYQCVNNCNDYYCAENCKRLSTFEGLNQLENMYQCFEDECSNSSTNQVFQACVLNECSDETNACLAIFGTNSCADINQCINACTTQNCAQSCYQSGSLEAQSQFDDFYECIDTQCSDVSNAEYQSCIVEQCTTVYEACIAPSNCNLLGGDCPQGQACHPLITGTGDCYDTVGIAQSEVCDLSGSTFQCIDGATCIGLRDEEAFCAQRCINQGCEIGFTCSEIGIDEYQACLPDDEPECSDEECDGLDNDCDMQIDEGCTSMGGAEAGTEIGAGTEAGAGTEIGAGTEAGAGTEIGAGTEAGTNTSTPEGGMMSTMTNNMLDIIEETAGMVSLVEEENTAQNSTTVDQGCAQSTSSLSQTSHGVFMMIFAFLFMVKRRLLNTI
jgi:V8-like Glu-specific endopeptidase